MAPNRMLAAGLFAALALGAACGSSDTAGSPPTSAGSPGPVPVVVDTDGGSDDAIALLYLLQHPAVEVIGITVSGTGIVHCDPGVDNVAGLVELAAPGASIPIACGPEVPTAGDRAFPDEWRSQADGRYGGVLPAGAAAPVDVSAPDLLADLARDAGRPITVLTLGPLTNVAAALDARPELAGDVARIVAMAGAFEVPGNVAVEGEPAAGDSEWNVYVDPTAAQAVLRAGVPVTFVPLDSQVGVDAFTIRAVAEAATSPPARTVGELLGSSPFFTSGAFALWDPLAAAVVADPPGFQSRDVRATITDAGVTTLDPDGTAATIATVAGRQPFLERFLGILDGQTDPLAIDRRSDTIVTVGPDTCRLTADTIEAGPAVLSIGLAGNAAIGTLDPTIADADIEAFLAAGSGEIPPWFSPVAVLQATGQAPVSTYVDMPAGRFTVVCLDLVAGAPTVTARTPLTATTAPPG